MITLKISMTTNQDYYSQTLIVSSMKLKLAMSTKILAVIKKCYEDFSSNKEMFDFSNFSTKSK